MTLDFSQNNINIVFEITDSGSVALKEFGCQMDNADSGKSLKWSPVVEVQLTGENQDDHHGAKHTGTYGSTSLKYNSHNYYENNYGNKLEFDLSDDKMSVTVHYQFYKSIAAVRSWTTVTNISSEPIGLEYVSSFAYTGLPVVGTKVYMPHNSWCREVNWKEYTLTELGLDRPNSFSSKRIVVSNTGTWSSKEHLPMAAAGDENTVFMWQIENNGSWQWEISDIDDRIYLKLSGPTEQENFWHKELARDESFESVKCCLALGDGFDSALAQMTLYRREISANNSTNSKLPVIFNDYNNCLLADPTEEKMIPVIDRAAEAGAEYYCMDAGWYANGTWWETVGEWQPCEWRFPGGIKKIFDYIRSKGMIPGIWLEIEVMGVLCPLADTFEDECFFMRHGRRVIDHGRYQLDFRSKKVREFATSVIDRVVGEYGVGYIKFDYNIEAGMGTEVDSHSFGDGLLEHNRALLGWIDSIKEKYPELILENCSSGGLRLDYAQLAHYHIQSVSDQESCRSTANIAAGAPTAVIPEQSAIWSYPLKDSDDNEVILNMVNTMLQRIHLSGGLHQMADEKFELVKEAIACYKTIRDDIPAAIPFYPMGIPKYGDGWLCLGMKSPGCTRIAVWRMDSDAEAISIPTDIQVQTVKRLYPPKSSYGVQVRDSEILVSLPERYCAVLFEI